MFLNCSAEDKLDSILDIISNRYKTTKRTFEEALNSFILEYAL